MIVRVEPRCISMGRKVTPKDQATLRVAGRDVSVSNLNKVMYPEVGFTKGQVIDYYTQVARYILASPEGSPDHDEAIPQWNQWAVFLRKKRPVFHPGLDQDLSHPADQ